MPVSAVKATSYQPEVVKASLDKAFHLLGLDTINPFKELIKPGQQVFIKPNWVAHRYRASCPSQHDVFTTITHPEVIRAVARYVDIALQGKGRIIIGDNPSIDADFPELMKVQQLEQLKDELDAQLTIVDLRPLVCKDLRDYGKHDKMHHQTGDPNGETIVNLGKNSMLYGLNPRLFRGVFNEREETIQAHSGENHLYSISNSIFQSDVFISVPKLKTHHKCGSTLNLKGLVGTMGVKNYLVHWREGFPAIGGDAYPNFWAWFLDRFKKVKKRGAWSGNDTIWRMVVDLYEVIQRGPSRFFSVVDGILGGEGNGPFCPKPNESKVLIAGTDLLETDVIATRLMGFEPERIAYLKHCLFKQNCRKEDIVFFSDFIHEENFFGTLSAYLDFIPPKNWQCLKIAAKGIKK